MEDSEKTRFTVIDLHDLHDLEDQKTRRLEDPKIEVRSPKSEDQTARLHNCKTAELS